jgi:carbamoyltransferase
MNFLGISFRNHDANIAYSSGTKVKYLKLEREFNQKHLGCIDYYFIQYVLDKWNINPSKINAVAYVTDMNNFDLPYYSKNLVEELKPTDWFFNKFKCPFFKIDHHYCHSLSMWPLVNKSDIDFVLDGVGDFEKTYSIFSQDKLIKTYELDEAESIGRCLTGEIADLNNIKGHWADRAGKLMGLKSFGKINQEYYALFKNDITEVRKLMSYRKYITTNSVTKKNPLNYLTSVHNKLEEIVLDFFDKNTTKDKVITYSGGVAQNSVINGQLKKKYKNLYIPPHCPDDGLSLGLIEFLRREYKQEPFENKNFPYWQNDICPNNSATQKTLLKTAELLSKGKIVGWYQGNGELGPRALGNRSILMHPGIKEGKDILNKNVKNREWFRPFGASIIEDKVKEYFDFEGTSEYMLYVSSIKDKITFPSITHIDGTCRIQTVNYNNNNLYYDLLQKFYKLTGVPMLLNTSLNVDGFPICSKPVYALQVFNNSKLDALVLGNEIYIK